MASSLSLVVITRNEEDNLGACLDSVPFAEEIVVIDDESTDRTREIAAARGARVIVRALDRFGTQKQFAIEQARGAWILVLDADERVSPELGEEIRRVLAREDPARDGYKLRRRTWIDGTAVECTSWYKCAHLRLFRRGAARYLPRRVHEYAVLEHPDRCGRLRGPLEHHTWQDAARYDTKFRRYARLAALDWYDAGRRCNVLTAPWYFLCVPTAAFLREWLVYRGYRAGRLGWRIATMSARADFLTARHLWKLPRTGERR